MSSVPHRGGLIFRYESDSTQRPLREAGIDPPAVRSIDFSHDGRRLVATAEDGRVAMWNAETWEPVDLPDDFPTTVVDGFSPDGQFFATAGSTGEVTLHDPITFDVVRVMRGLSILDSEIRVVRLVGRRPTADGRHVLTLVDGVPRLWDLDTGMQIGDEFPRPTESHSGAASDDELQLVTSQDGALMVWNLDTDSWAPIACRAAGRNMTQAEWDSFGPAGEPYRSTCAQFPPAD